MPPGSIFASLVEGPSFSGASKNQTSFTLLLTIARTEDWHLPHNLSHPEF